MLRNESSGADAGCHKTLPRETVICDRNRSAGYAEAPRQFPSGREKLAGPKPAIEDRPAELPIDLRTQILAAGEIDVHVHRPQYMRARFADWTGQM